MYVHINVCIYVHINVSKYIQTERTSESAGDGHTKSMLEPNLLSDVQKQVHYAHCNHCRRRCMCVCVCVCVCLFSNVHKQVHNALYYTQNINT